MKKILREAGCVLRASGFFVVYRGGMMKIMQFYFRKWWVPSAVLAGFYALLIFLFWGSMFLIIGGGNFLGILFFIGNFLLLLGIFSSAFVHFYKKRWFSGIINLVSFSIFAFLLYVSVINIIGLFMPSEDRFADHLVIPHDIEIESPREADSERFLNDPPEPPEFLKYSEQSVRTEFILVDSFQPGIYDYELRVNTQEAGQIYLKAFEVTQGTPLSAGRLKNSTLSSVGWSDNPNQMFYANAGFTIYEGDWGKPYAARFEVWFIPDSGAPERKLTEKNFKIEGWMR